MTGFRLTRARQELGDALDYSRIVEPRPVARAGDDLDLRLAAECVGVGVSEARRKERVVLPPHDEGGGAKLAESVACALEDVRRRRAVEAEDRALGAVVEVLDHGVGAVL